MYEFLHPQQFNFPVRTFFDFTLPYSQFEKRPYSENCKSAKGAYSEAVSIMDQGGGGRKRKGLDINKETKRMKTIFSE